MRPLLEPVHEKARKSNAARKPFDVVLMFKMLVLQTPYNLADEQVGYRICDRLSFARFLSLGIEDAVPDATTVWRFRERLQEQGLPETVFVRFDDFPARGTVGSRRVSFPKTGVGRNGRKKMWMGALDEKARQSLFRQQKSHQYRRGAQNHPPLPNDPSACA